MKVIVEAVLALTTSFRFTGESGFVKITAPFPTAEATDDPYRLYATILA